MSKKRKAWKKQVRFNRFIITVLNERSKQFTAAYRKNPYQALEDMQHGCFDL